MGFCFMMFVMDRIPQVLICDDDQLFHLVVRQSLKDKTRCLSAYNSDEGAVILKKNPVDIVLLDVQMRTPDEGLRAIETFKAIDPEVTIIMASGLTDFKVVREAMTLGAQDYVAKDSESEQLLHRIEVALQGRKLAKNYQQKDSELLNIQRQHVLVGKSPKIELLRKMIEKVRSSSANVLIFGETGTGKEVVARQLRKNNPDGSLAPFQSIDSSTIQSTTAESLLFGHEKGAFTGADKVKKGIFEEADGGTVYFDEIANMPMDIQAKLLRVLQEKEVTRLGSAKVMNLDFRVVCATNKNLDDMVKQGQFREDLLQRINVLPIELPPLRERTEDIPLLVNHFVKKQSPHRAVTFSDDALEVLMNYPWPGNIRELSNLVAYVIAMSDEAEINSADLPPKVRDRACTTQAGASVTDATISSTDKFYDQVATYEKKILAVAYEQNGGNVSKTALGLGMDRSHLHSKLKEYGIYSRKQKT